MRIVLLAGGSGKRLWPLSNDVRSKIYLRLLHTDSGGRESMIQRVCRQLDSAGLLSSTHILTHRSQVDITLRHVGERIPIIAEPYKRGTFPAVALAAAYFQSAKPAGPDEIICIVPVDVLADNAFFEQLHRLPDVLRESGAELALIGTHPTFPSTQYGYILPKADSRTDYRIVERFVEKPDSVRAGELIASNALWNCGVFAFPLQNMITRLRHLGLPADFDELLRCYESMSESSFDEKVVEKSADAVVLPYSGPWNDLGSWGVFAEQLGSRVLGTGEVSADSRNTHLVNELPIPVHVVDVSDTVVAAGPDGILVASKEQSNRIKEIIGKTPETPRFEEKRWGTVRVLDRSVDKANQRESVTVKIELLPGKDTGYFLHLNRRKVWAVLSGSAELLLDGRIRTVGSGEVVEIPPGTKHGLKAVTAVEMIEVQIGTKLDEDDVDNAAVSWKEALRTRINNDEVQ